MGVHRGWQVGTRGPNRGPCNICSTVGPLTEDHVPPKGALQVPQHELFNIIQLLNQRPERRQKGRQMQDGVKFKTLCGRCNNTLLGARYDPVLLRFGNDIIQYLASAKSVALPEVISVTTVPGLLARAVLGHLFAVGVGRNALSPLEQEAANFFLDEAKPLPEGINIFYWIYPQRQQVQVRDAMLLTDFFKSHPIRFFCLKYFPVAFMVTWNLDDRNRILAPDLGAFMLYGGGHPADLPLSLRSIPHPLWPEAPTSNGAVVYGNDALGALPRAK